MNRLELWWSLGLGLSGTVLGNRRFFRMEQADLEKWVSSENIALFRDRLADRSYEALHVQYLGLLDQELAKMPVKFPN